MKKEKKKVYIVELTNGQTIVADDYYNSFGSMMHFNGISKNGNYNYDVVKENIVRITETDYSKLPKEFKKAFNL